MNASVIPSHTPSRPGAGPRSDGFRCGGRESKFLLLTFALAILSMTARLPGQDKAVTQSFDGPRSLSLFREKVAPLLQKYCAECHGETKQKQDLRLDHLNPNMAEGTDGELWHDVLDQLNSGAMPPKAKPQPTKSEREVLFDWLTAELNRAAAQRNSTGGRVVLRRMTQYEYQNTMTDLLGIDFDFAKGLSPDERSRNGFRNNGSTMKFTSEHLRHYIDTARRALQIAIVTDEPERPVLHSNKTPNNTVLRLNRSTKPNERVWVPFAKGILRVKVKVRPFNDEVQLLGVAAGREGDRINDLKLIDEVEFRGTKRAPTADWPKGEVALDHWYSLGPFSGSLDEDFGPEKKPLALQGKFPAGGKEIAWERRPDVVEGYAHRFSPGDKHCTYFSRNIKSQDARPLPISLGCRDGVKVWINGNEVLSSSKGHDQKAKFAVNLNKGDNQLLVKIHNLGRDGLMYFKCDAVDPPPDFESQEFTLDVEMATCPKQETKGSDEPAGGRRHLYIGAWDANDIPFQSMLNLSSNSSAEDLPDPKGFIIESLEAAGPIVDPWPPKSHSQIFIPSPNSGNEKVYAREILAQFMRRAWRRPIAKAELDEMAAQYETNRADLEFVAAIRETLVAVLSSPNFIFLIEPTADTKSVALTDHELATRLSYFLWSTMPDETLSRLADSGKLRDPAVLRRTVSDMLSHGRAKNFVKHFTLQWLKLDLLEKTSVDPKVFHGYESRLTRDMVQETLCFFEEVLRKDMSVLTLIDADFTFLTRRLAKHYGIPFPKEATRTLGQYVRVSLRDEPHRGGLLTHGSVLLAGSDGKYSHPVRRGAWVLDRLLARPPPEPPPNVPALDAASPNSEKLTLKQKLALHLSSSACASCHEKFDPFGVTFEHYDAVGIWHETRKLVGSTVETVDAIAQLQDGTTLDGVPGLKKYLLSEKRDVFVEGFVRYLLSYALGRSLEYSDRPTVEQLTRQFGKDAYKISALIQALATSDLFQRK